MKNVLLLVHDDTGQEARLQGALDLTRALSGHLDCVDVTPLPLMADPLWSAGSASIIYDETDREAANACRVQERLAGEDVPWGWNALRGDFPDCLAGALHAADLVVLNRTLDALPAPDMRTIIGNLLSDNEVLVVAVPADAKGFAATGSALIAWDGSATVMRTVQRAIPLLTLAASVTIVQVGDLPGGAIAADEAARYLARHGIKPNIDRLPASRTVATEISRSAGRLGSSYCLMGAYGHGRLREALFGGVTQELLGSTGLPLVLGH
jgi:nucleotide-binding universal stress UspA family protein